VKIYNGEGMLLGRLATIVAKQALLGEEISVINCEKIVVSGHKTVTFAREWQRRQRGGYPLKSQTRSRLPDRFVRRAIRGMLPWRQERGRTAYKRILCYTGIPAAFAAKELVAIPEASKTKLPTLKYVTVGQICTYLGGPHDQ